MKTFWLLLLALGMPGLLLAQTNLSPAANVLRATIQTNSLAVTNTNSPRPASQIISLPVTNASRAVTHTNTPATTNAPRAPTQIFAEKTEINIRDRSVTYRGNVRVEDPQMTMTCELLTAQMLTNSAKPKPSSIVAEQNVVIDAIDGSGEKAHATAGKLVYAYDVAGGVTNETIRLSGNPVITSAQGQFKGEPIVWDLVSGRIVADLPEMKINQSTNTIAPILEKTGLNKK